MKALKSHQFFTILLIFFNGVMISSSKNHLFVALTRVCTEILKQRIYYVDETFLGIIVHSPGGNRTAILPVNDESAEKLTRLNILDPEAPTVVILHGLNDNAVTTFSLRISDIYLEKKIYNVLVLDSSKTSHEFQYFKDVDASWQIGKIVGNFFANLYRGKVLKPSKIHIIGMSMGSQTAAQISRTFKKLTGKKIGRVTALDPPGICFDYGKRGLNKRDAEFVDIIHSNIGVMGSVATRGHVDFLLNGYSPYQPGCGSNHRCSHKRAALVYIASLMDDIKPFFARKCHSWSALLRGECDKNNLTVIGFDLKTSTRGFYFLKTYHKWPYSLGLEGIKF